MPEVFAIKVRHFQSQMELEVTGDTTISQIKDMIAPRLSLSVLEQRLISQGKVLSDTDTVQQAKLQPGFVLQVVKKDLTPPPAPIPDTDRRLDSLFSLQTLLNSMNTGLLPERGPRPRPRRPVPLVYKLESIRQNLLTVECLLETRATPWMWTSSGELFNLHLRKLQPGQWVDVKDTENAWLEAQVVDVRTQKGASAENFTFALVHYNEWSVQWDEWIEGSSPRIQPFRMFTKQAQDSPVQSPFPVMLSPEVFRHHSSLLEVSDYVHLLATLLESVQPLLDQYFRRPPEPESEEDMYESDFEPPSDNEDVASNSHTAHLKLGQQLAIIMDRLGRAIADLSFFVEMGTSSLDITRLRLPVMPTLSESRVTDQETEIRIHAIFAPLSHRRR